MREESSRIEEVMLHVDDMVKSIQKMSVEVIDLFVHATDARYLIFERIHLFGPLVIEPLRGILANSQGDLKVLSAIALAKMGALTDWTVLYNEVKSHRKYSCLSMEYIELHDPLKAQELALEFLRTIDIQNVQTNPYMSQALCMLYVIERSGNRPPIDVLEKYSREDMPKDIELFMKVVSPKWRG